MGLSILYPSLPLFLSLPSFFSSGARGPLLEASWNLEGLGERCEPSEWVRAKPGHQTTPVHSEVRSRPLESGDRC